ncbi:hypothetical protein WN944_001453 [Citrus x changshan-huyou]|uniref:Uncharacterized protein n=1 Tax=Citrus x changshan-huyou TaxID=2935761 RepID=A0AAP0MH70_9ROSI
MGPDGHGYARTYGHGPTPSDVIRTKSNEANEILQQESPDATSSHHNNQNANPDFEINN